MKLVKSKVIFDPKEHTYTLDGERLSGITSLLDRQLFADKYDGIPDEVLKKAAERGTLIHQSCELADEGFPVDTVESKNWLAMKAKYNLHVEESEYLVSDNKHYASCIDKVFRYDDTTFFLGDIKTTYKLNKEYVRWQLSIYAYLFEHQNPGARVTSIFAIWLRGDTAQLVELERVADTEIERLLDCDSKGEKYSNTIVQADALPVAYKDIEQRIALVETHLKKMEAQRKELYEEIMKAMVKYGVYQWTGEVVKFTRRKESIRKTFDKERFEKDYPGVYGQYVKETPTAGSLTIKVL